MKAWIEQRIKLMHEKNRNVIVFPVERRQNDIAEKRYKEIELRDNGKRNLNKMINRQRIEINVENDDGPEVA